MCVGRKGEWVGGGICVAGIGVLVEMSSVDGGDLNAVEAGEEVVTAAEGFVMPLARRVVTMFCGCWLVVIYYRLMPRVRDVIRDSCTCAERFVPGL